jgi:hypothetical protein
MPWRYIFPCSCSLASYKRLLENPRARGLLIAVITFLPAISDISDKSRREKTRPRLQFNLLESPLLNVEPLSVVIPLLRKCLNLGSFLSPRRRRTRLGSYRSGNFCCLGCFDGGFEESCAEAEGTVRREDAGDLRVRRGV